MRVAWELGFRITQISCQNMIIVTRSSLYFYKRTDIHKPNHFLNAFVGTGGRHANIRQENSAVALGAV